MASMATPVVSREGSPEAPDKPAAYTLVTNGQETVFSPEQIQQMYQQMQRLQQQPQQLQQQQQEATAAATGAPPAARPAALLADLLATPSHTGLPAGGTPPTAAPPAAAPPAAAPPAAAPPAAAPPAAAPPAAPTPPVDPASITPAAPSTEPKPDIPKIQLTRVENEFLAAAEEYLPTLLSQDETWILQFENIFCPTFKGKNPEMDILNFLFYSDNVLRNNQDRNNAVNLMSVYVEDPTPVGDMDWGDDQVLMDHRMEEAWDILDRMRDEGINSQPEHDAEERKAITYDSGKRRAIRSKYRSKASNPEADQCTVPCPETGKQVRAEILGRHPHRKKYLALALPSNNTDHPTIGRGHYIDGALDAYSAIYKTYCSQGSNHTLSIATDKEMLEECSPNEYEQNVVFTMPWGKTWRYASYGVPHGRVDRDFVLFPKAILASAWGMAVAVDVMTGQMQKAGQPVKGKVASDKVKAKSWGM